MSTPNAKQAAENLLTDYAEVLNTANSIIIPSFYTFDGLFMPDGYPSIKAYDLKNCGEKYLKKNNFHISFNILQVNEENGFVFVEAKAITKISTGNGSKATQRNSRDYFILRKEDTVWKIYRYIFNREQE